LIHISGHSGLGSYAYNPGEKREENQENKMILKVREEKVTEIVTYYLNSF
jgi:hypothetical protein